MTENPSKKPSRLLPIANVVTSQFATALGIAGSFIITPTMISALGEERNGAWQLMLSMVSYMKLLDLGMSAGTVKYAAGALARENETDLRKLFSTAWAFFLISAAVAVVGVLSLSILLPRVYPQLDLDGMAIVLIGSALVADLLTRTSAAGLRAKSLFFVNDGLEVVTYCVFRLGALVFFAHHGGLTYRLLGALVLLDRLCCDIVVSISAFVVAPYVRRANPFEPSSEMMSKLSKMGVAMSIMQVADLVRFQLDAGIIGKFLPEPGVQITIFSIGTRLPSISFTAIGVIGAVLMPRFSGMAETGDQAGLKALLRRGNLATGLVAVFVLVNIAVIGPHFLELWLKKPWVSISGKIQLLMLPGYFIALLAGPSSSVIIGSGKLRGLTAITVGEATLNLILSVILVKPYGIFGVAIGTVIPMIVVRGVVFPLLLEKELGITPSEYFRSHARPVLLGVVYLALVSGLAFVPLTSYLRFFLVSGLSAVVFFVLLFLTVPEARAALPGILARLRGRPKSA